MSCWVLVSWGQIFVLIYFLEVLEICRNWRLELEAGHFGGKNQRLLVKKFKNKVGFKIGLHSVLSNSYFSLLHMLKFALQNMYSILFFGGRANHCLQKKFFCRPCMYVIQYINLSTKQCKNGFCPYIYFRLEYNTELI